MMDPWLWLVVLIPGSDWSLTSHIYSAAVCRSEEESTCTDPTSTTTWNNRDMIMNQLLWLLLLLSADRWNQSERADNKSNDSESCVCVCVCDSRLQVDDVQDVDDDRQVVHGDGGVQSALQTGSTQEVKRRRRKSSLMRKPDKTSKYSDLWLDDWLSDNAAALWLAAVSQLLSPWCLLWSKRTGPSPGSCVGCSASRTSCRDPSWSETTPPHHSERRRHGY